MKREPPENAGDLQAGRRSQTAGRGRSGRFEPGQSGNPAGKPPGTRSRATLIAQELLGDDGEAIVRKAIEMAKAGDPVALRLCIDRLVPALRGPVVELDLPAVRRAEDVRGACAAVIAAAAAGRISLREAREFMALLDVQRRAIETDDLAVRIQLLEKEVA